MPFKASRGRHENAVRVVNKSGQDLEQLRSALSKARLEKEQYKSSLSELQKILDLCRVISSAQDLEDILKHLLLLLGEILPSRGCAVFLEGGEPGRSGGTPILTNDLTPRLRQALDQHFEEGIIRWILNERRVCIVPSFDEEGGDAPAGDYAVIPLGDNGGAFGFIWIACSIGHEQVTPETLNLIWVLSSQASVAILNCLHRRRMEEKINEMRVLTSISALKGDALRQASARAAAPNPPDGNAAAAEPARGNLAAFFVELHKLLSRELKLEGGFLILGSEGNYSLHPPQAKADGLFPGHAEMRKLMRLADRELVRVEAGDFFASAYPFAAQTLGCHGLALLSLSPGRAEPPPSESAGVAYLLLPLSASDLQRLPAFQNLLPAAVTQARVVAENVGLYDSLLAANRNLTAMQWQLVHSGKMAALGQLAGGVAHEINNPLQIMLGRVQMIQMMADDPKERGGSAKVKEELHLVTEEILRIRDIVKNLLDFSRQGVREASFSPVSLNDTLSEVLTLLHHQLESGGVEVKLDLDPENPRLMGNKNQLKQVFINLFVNAAHAMEKDPKVLEVRTRLRGGDVEAVIRDSGVGISQENLHRIFEPFYTTKSMGTGLGLSISYGIVKDHKGTIEVESQEARGTSFIVRIPRLDEQTHGYNQLVG
jgi:signal transduction histidine kinase